MFSTASFSVLPWDQQPGRPGHETLKPSLDFFNTTLYFIAHILDHDEFKV